MRVPFLRRRAILSSIAASINLLNKVRFPFKVADA